MLLFVYTTLVTSDSIAQPLEWNSEFHGSSKIDRGMIDPKQISRVRNFLIFPAAYESTKVDGKPKWYDLVAFNCLTSEYKVIFATELDAPPTTMSELLVDKNEAQADAQAYGFMHNWAAMKGLTEAMKRSCGKAPRSTHKYLPFQFGDTANSVWWLDLANLEIGGQVRKAFAFSRQFKINKVKKGLFEFDRIEFTKGNELTYRWSMNCAKRTTTTLFMAINDANGVPAETIHKTGPEETIVPNTIGQLAFEFICSL